MKNNVLNVEKVLLGLSCCRDMDNPPGYRMTGCIDCPYSIKNKTDEDDSGSKYCCVRALKDDLLIVVKDYISLNIVGKATES